MKNESLFRCEKDCFKKTLEAIEWFLEYGIPVDLVCTVMDYNWQDLAYVAHLAEQIGASSLTFSGIIPEGRAKHMAVFDYRIVKEEILHLREELSLPIRTVRMFNVDFSSCHKGMDMIGIDYLGYVHPCLQDKLPDALNINDYSLEECIEHLDNNYSQCNCYN